MTPVLPLPKYHQIYLVLREQLREGQFAAGLPPEVALSKQFGAGRVTVRRALGHFSTLLMRPAAAAPPPPSLKLKFPLLMVGSMEER